MYVCLYVPEIQPKWYTIVQKFLAHLTYHSPTVCRMKFRSNQATKKLFKKSIPDSVKYSSGVFDQGKQPQRYSLLELSFLFLLSFVRSFVFVLFFFNDFFINRCHNGNPTGSQVV